MFIEERHQEILKILSEKGRISNSEIHETFQISYDSAKRDLRLLEEQGLLKRTLEIIHTPLRLTKVNPLV